MTLKIRHGITTLPILVILLSAPFGAARAQAEMQAQLTGDGQRIEGG